MHWHNFATGEDGYLDEAPSAEEMPKFIPQIPSAQGLYRCHIAMGKNHIEAAIEVLSVCIGKEPA